MRPISPNTGAPERVYAEDQSEYMPLSVAHYAHEDGSRSRVTAWVPRAAELPQLARELDGQLSARGVYEAVRAAAAPEVVRAAVARALAEFFTDRPVVLTLVDFGGPLTPHMVDLGVPDWMRVEAPAHGGDGVDA